MPEPPQFRFLLETFPTGDFLRTIPRESMASMFTKSMSGEGMETVKVILQVPGFMKTDVSFVRLVDLGERSLSVLERLGHTSIVATSFIGLVCCHPPEERAHAAKLAALTLVCLGIASKFLIKRQ